MAAPEAVRAARCGCRWESLERRSLPGDGSRASSAVRCCPDHRAGRRFASSTDLVGACTCRAMAVRHLQFAAGPNTACVRALRIFHGRGARPPGPCRRIVRAPLPVMIRGNRRRCGHRLRRPGASQHGHQGRLPAGHAAPAARAAASSAPAGPMARGFQGVPVAGSLTIFSRSFCRSANSGVIFCWIAATRFCISAGVLSSRLWPAGLS